MIDDGAKFQTGRVFVWEDTGTWDAALHANRYLLRKIDTHTHPYMKGTTIVIPPSFIADGTTIDNSIIGPYVSISEGVTINESIIKNSIVASKAQVTNSVLFGAMIGERAVVEGSYRTINIGDDSVVSFSDAVDTVIDEKFK
jgi:glucose-1-phosphate thymidylyltransferase